MAINLNPIGATISLSFSFCLSEKMVSDADNEIDFYGDLSPSFTKSCLELECENYISSLWFDKEEEMMGSNAIAAEQQAVLVPSQKPYPEAEAKMIPFYEITDKDASSSDHQNDFYGHLQLSLTESWIGSGGKTMILPCSLIRMKK